MKSFEGCYTEALLSSPTLMNILDPNISTSVPPGLYRTYENLYSIPAALGAIEYQLYLHSPKERKLSWKKDFMEACGEEADQTLSPTHFFKWLSRHSNVKCIRENPSHLLIEASAFRPSPQICEFLEHPKDREGEIALQLTRWFLWSSLLPSHKIALVADKIIKLVGAEEPEAIEHMANGLLKILETNKKRTT